MFEKNVLDGPPGHFVMGNLPEFRKDPLTFLSRCGREYGEIVPIRLLHLSAYLVFNPDHIEYILSTHNRDFVKSRMYQVAERVLGGGVVLSEGAAWLRQRRLMQPAFHRERIEGYGRIMVDYADRMLSTWSEGQILEISQWMLRLSNEIVTKALFNCDADNDPDGMVEAVKSVFKEAAVRFSNPFSLPESIPTPGNLRFQRVVERLDKLVYSLIRQRRTTGEDVGDLLSMLLQAQDEDGSRLSDPQLQSEVRTLLIAGFETAAMALSWTWYLLAKHPEVEAKLLAELETVLGGRKPTVADLPKLRYTEMVVMETLRLYPPGPLMGRESTSAFEMGDYHFPARSEFWIVSWVIHRNPHYYEAPEEFRPERWEGDLIKRLPKFAYFPFSHGPRVCMGNTFASMEVILALVTIIQRFHLDLAPGEVVTPEFALTLRPKNGIKMVLTERHRSS